MPSADAPLSLTPSVGQLKLIPKTPQTKKDLFCSFHKPKELKLELSTKDGSSHPRKTLEDLPSELRRHLLLTLDLRALAALVRASPVYHQQYRLDRRFILLKSFERSVRSVSIDACAAYRSGTLRFSTARTKKNVTQFIRSYREQRRNLASYSVTAEGLTEKDAVDMVVFHNTVVMPHFHKYLKTALAKFPKIDKLREGPLDQAHISPTEEIRVLRALYRFQIACNAYGTGPYLSVRPKKLEFDAGVILKQFLCFYEPWEIEEIGCIYTYARDKYHNLLADPWDDLYDFNEANMDEEYEWNRDVEYDHITKCAISRGLEQLLLEPSGDIAQDDFDDAKSDHMDSNSEDSGVEDAESDVASSEDSDAMDLEESDFEAMADTIETILKKQHMCGAFFQEAVSYETQIERRKACTTRRDTKEKNKETMLFQGDQEKVTSTTAPLAWSLLWDGLYSNFYGQFICEGLRSWGYVFWSAHRIMKANLEEHIEEHLNSHHGDPRAQVEEMLAL